MSFRETDVRDLRGRTWLHLWQLAAAPLFRSIETVTNGSLTDKAGYLICIVMLRPQTVDIRATKTSNLGFSSRGGDAVPRMISALENS